MTELSLQSRGVFFLLVLISLSHAEFASRIENSNFTISQDGTDQTYLYNYDRLRFRTDYTHGAFFATLIADGVNYYGEDYVNSLDFQYIKLQKSDTPFKTQTSLSDYSNGASYAKLYRLYGGYEDDANRLVIGLQNIAMGVGHVWTPTNIFNPTNIYALEPDETFGIFGVTYTRHISDTSQITLVGSQREDDSYKFALQYKAYFDFADFAIDGVYSDDTKMLGYEVEANLGETGIEVRSEGAYIKSKLKQTAFTVEEEEFFQCMVGAEYAFIDGITLTGEALYSSKKFSYAQTLLNHDSEIVPNLVNSHLYTALTLSYSFNIYLDASLLYIESFDDGGDRYIAPNVTYTLNDYNALTAGAMLHDSGDTYYLKWVFSF
jgi:hypothetical protein